MHDAAHARARGRADRDDVAPAAQRHRGVGRALGLIERSQDRAQLVHDVLARFADPLARACEILRRTVEHLPVWRDRLDEPGFELSGGWVDSEQKRALCAVRRAKALEIGRDNAHRGERDRQLRERRRVERTALDREQLERLCDVGNRLGANRFVGDQQRRQLGDLRERVADRRGIRVGESRGDACRTQGPRGVLGHPRESLGKFERL